jgi:serine/threonine protein phosphatase PrpC
MFTGACAVVALVRKLHLENDVTKRYLFVANVGDSRAVLRHSFSSIQLILFLILCCSKKKTYKIFDTVCLFVCLFVCLLLKFSLSRKGVATRLTVDHNVDDEQEKQRIIASGGFINGGRVNGIDNNNSSFFFISLCFFREIFFESVVDCFVLILNVWIGMIVVTRSLGDHNMKDYLSNEPHVECVELTPDDDLLVLACDGVWDVIQDQEAIDLIKNETAADRMSRILMVKALQVLSSHILTLLHVEVFGLCIHHI